MNSTKNRDATNQEMIVVFIIFVICIFLSFVIVPDEIMEFIGLNP